MNKSEERFIRGDSNEFTDDKGFTFSLCLMRMDCDRCEFFAHAPSLQMLKRIAVLHPSFCKGRKKIPLRIFQKPDKKQSSSR